MQRDYNGYNYHMLQVKIDFNFKKILSKKF